MNKEIMRTMGFSDHVDKVENGQCPFCNEIININNFKDKLSLDEYKISGLCQKCQDRVFN